jgi:radical SAM superfamily enzyme YgiQ (UPF0313 family)
MKKILFISFYKNPLVYDIMYSILYKKYKLSSFIFLDDDFLNSDFNSSKSNFKESDFLELCSHFDFIFLTSNIGNKNFVFYLGNLLKDHDVVLGGPLAINEPRACEKHFRYVCYWESENILDFLNYIENKSKELPPNYLISGNCSNLKYSSSSDLNNTKYVIPKYESIYLYFDKNIKKYEGVLIHSDVETMRGCQDNCSFCSNSFINKIKKTNNLPLIKYKNEETLFDELKLKDHDNSFIVIRDDNFLFHDEQFLENFVNFYNSNISSAGLYFNANLRTKNIIEKFKILLKLKTNIIISLGLQSASNRMKKLYGIYSPDNHKSFFHAFKKILSTEKKNMKIFVDLILANPLEKRKDILDTINYQLYLSKLYSKKIEFQVNFYSHLPNTNLSLTKFNDIKSQETKNFVIFPERFEKDPFLYFSVFLINHVNKLGFSFLLPKKIRYNFFFKII